MESTILVNRLFGRNLEPWRGMLAVAAWLDSRGGHGLWERMEQLSWDYQSEKKDVETSDLTSLVIRSLCHCAIGAISANGQETPHQFIFTSQEIAEAAKQIAEQMESSENPDTITTKRVGRILGQMRLQKAPRPGGKGSRRWKITINELHRWTQTYNVELPTPLDTHGTNGTNGTDGTDLQPNHMESCDCVECVGEAPDATFVQSEATLCNDLIRSEQPTEVCYSCGSNNYWQKQCGEWVCDVCHPQPV